MGLAYNMSVAAPSGGSRCDDASALKLLNVHGHVM